MKKTVCVIASVIALSTAGVASAQTMNREDAYPQVTANAQGSVSLVATATDKLTEARDACVTLQLVAPAIQRELFGRMIADTATLAYPGGAPYAMTVLSRGATGQMQLATARRSCDNAFGPLPPF
jgi:hypothetical protein